MPQDAIRGSLVEEEIGHRVLRDVGRAGEHKRLARIGREDALRYGKQDLDVLLPVQAVLGQPLEKGNRPGDALAQLRKRRLVLEHVLLGDVDADALERVLARVGGQVDLKGKRLHVDRESLGEPGVWVDVARFRVLFGFVEHVGEVAEAAQEDGHADVVEGEHCRRRFGKSS